MLDHLAKLLAELTSNDDSRALNAVEKLEKFGDGAISPLLTLLQMKNADHRWWAVRTLAAFDGERSTTALIQSLSDTDISVRECASIALRKNPSVKAMGALINALQHQDRLLARLAGDALTAIGPDAIPALADLLRTGNAAVRGESARALAKMEDQETIAILFSALEDSSSIVRYWVEEGLNMLKVGMVFFDA